jgi:hypothetical protein
VNRLGQYDNCQEETVEDTSILAETTAVSRYTSGVCFVT